MHRYYELIIPPKVGKREKVFTTENQIVIVILQWDLKNIEILEDLKLDSKLYLIIYKKIAKKIEWSNQFRGIKTMQKY